LLYQPLAEGIDLCMKIPCLFLRLSISMQVSFVNPTKGGTHVNYLVDQITRYVSGLSYLMPKFMWVYHPILCSYSLEIDHRAY